MKWKVLVLALVFVGSAAAVGLAPVAESAGGCFCSATRYTTNASVFGANDCGDAQSQLDAKLRQQADAHCAAQTGETYCNFQRVGLLNCFAASGGLYGSSGSAEFSCLTCWEGPDVPDRP